MSQSVKPMGRDSAPGEWDSNGDTLRFLNRTLQFHSSDCGNQNVFKKLQLLKGALDRQEATLLSWPDSPSKDRIRRSLSQAKSLVAQIIDGFDGWQTRQSDARDIETA